MAYGSNICSRSFFTIIVFRNRFSQIDFPTYFRERFFSQHRFSNSCLLLPRSFFKVGFVTKIVFQSRFPKSIFSVIFKIFLTTIVFQYRFFPSRFYTNHFSNISFHQNRFSNGLRHAEARCTQIVLFQHLCSPKSFFKIAFPTETIKSAFIDMTFAIVPRRKLLGYALSMQTLLILQRWRWHQQAHL